MDTAKFKQWMQANWKGLAIAAALMLGMAGAIMLFKKLFAAGSAPSVSSPDQDPVEASRAESFYDDVKDNLPKDQLYYKSLADSIQQYLQTHTFFFSSDLFTRYFEELSDPEFVAVYYFWGNREYTGSVWNNPFQGIDDKYGNLVEALRARCFTDDFQQIQTKFVNTKLI